MLDAYIGQYGPALKRLMGLDAGADQQGQGPMLPPPDPSGGALPAPAQPPQAQGPVGALPDPGAASTAQGALPAPPQGPVPGALPSQQVNAPVPPPGMAAVNAPADPSASKPAKGTSFDEVIAQLTPAQKRQMIKQMQDRAEQHGTNLREMYEKALQQGMQAPPPEKMTNQKMGIYIMKFGLHMMSAAGRGANVAEAMGDAGSATLQEYGADQDKAAAMAAEQKKTALMQAGEMLRQQDSEEGMNTRQADSQAFQAGESGKTRDFESGEKQKDRQNARDLEDVAQRNRVAIERLRAKLANSKESYGTFTDQLSGNVYNVSKNGEVTQVEPIMVPDENNPGKTRPLQGVIQSKVKANGELTPKDAAELKAKMFQDAQKADVMVDDGTGKKKRFTRLTPEQQNAAIDAQFRIATGGSSTGSNPFDKFD
jgi:hypothetical protein